MSLIRGHLSRDPNEVKKLDLERFGGRSGTGKFPEAGTGLMCLGKSRDDSFVEWREQVGTQQEVKPEVVGAQQGSPHRSQ